MKLLPFEEARAKERQWAGPAKNLASIESKLDPGRTDDILGKLSGTGRTICVLLYARYGPALQILPQDFCDIVFSESQESGSQAEFQL